MNSRDIAIKKRKNNKNNRNKHSYNNQQNIKKDEIKSDKNEVNIDSKEKINLQSIEEQNDDSNKEISANNQKVKKKKRIGKLRKKAIDDNDAPNDSEKDNFNINDCSANNEILAKSELNDNPFIQSFELEELKKNRKKNYIENSNILDKILNNLYVGYHLF